MHVLISTFQPESEKCAGIHYDSQSALVFGEWHLKTSKDVLTLPCQHGVYITLLGIGETGAQLSLPSKGPSLRTITQTTVSRERFTYVLRQKSEGCNHLSIFI